LPVSFPEQIIYRIVSYVTNCHGHCQAHPRNGRMLLLPLDERRWKSRGRVVAAVAVANMSTECRTVVSFAAISRYLELL